MAMQDNNAASRLSPYGRRVIKGDNDHDQLFSRFKSFVVIDPFITIV